MQISPRSDHAKPYVCSSFRGVTIYFYINLIRNTSCYGLAWEHVPLICVRHLIIARVYVLMSTIEVNPIFRILLSSLKWEHIGVEYHVQWLLHTEHRNAGWEIVQLVFPLCPRDNISFGKRLLLDKILHFYEFSKSKQSIMYNCMILQSVKLLHRYCFRANAF